MKPLAQKSEYAYAFHSTCHTLGTVDPWVEYLISAKLVDVSEPFLTENQRLSSRQPERTIRKEKGNA